MATKDTKDQAGFLVVPEFVEGQELHLLLGSSPSIAAAPPSHIDMGSSSAAETTSSSSETTSSSSETTSSSSETISETIPSTEIDSPLSIPIKTTSSSPEERIGLNCIIQKAFRPFTFSAVLLVSLVQPPSGSPHHRVSLPANAILKLYDRRCFIYTRKTFDDGKQWSLEKERKYQQYLHDVSARLVTPENFNTPVFYCDGFDGEFEAYLQHMAHNMFRVEFDTYERLRPLQGKKIPRLYGAVEYELTIPNARDDGSAITETIPGVLLEYISPLSLRQLVTTWTARDPPLPNVVLTTLCGEVVKVVDHVSDFDVLNDDIRMDNFMIREPFVTSPSPGEEPSIVDDAVVLIDLARCRFREEDEDDRAWIRAKAITDETGAAGSALLDLVNKFVGCDVWSYASSNRWYYPFEELFV